MLERKAYGALRAWKASSQGSTALLIEGARRVGKSTLVEKFGKAEYRSCLFIDFFTAPPEVKNYFQQMSTDLDSLFVYLSAFYGVKLYPRETLIVFDEIQFYPFARGLIKYLVADGRYDYIETGSLVSIKQNVRDIIIPSEERAIELNPMDFEEFCWAMGQAPLVDVMRNSAEQLKPLPDALHGKCERLFREYMLVGGMPAVVADYVESRDFGKIDAIKRDILTLYRNDIGRFAKGYEFKVGSVFDGIPGQLSKHEKKFSLSTLGGDPRMRTYEEAFFWLEDARIANICYNATDPGIGLALSRDQSTLKCYMADTGLLVTHAFSDNAHTSDKVFRDILLGKLSLNEGMITENAVAQALRANGHRLFFYSRFDREDASARMEVDFLITQEYANAGGKMRTTPLEVKSTKRYGTASLDKFRKKFGKRVGREYVIHPKTLEVQGDRVHLPLYLAFCL